MARPAHLEQPVDGDSASGREPPGAGRLKLEGATHAYSNVVVLQDVDLELVGGEVHGVVGENGSGKSTLIRILTGVIRPVRGRITLDGEPVSFASPVDAQRHGIAVVHQESQLFPDLSVADCVFGVGTSPPRKRWTRSVDRAAVERRVAEIFGQLGIDLPPHAKTASLDAAERKFVEIARAMATQPRFLILDEATASFEPNAASAVLGVLANLARRGVGICFISHRLDEVLEIADRITVLRDGRRVGLLTGEEADERRLVQLIVGDRGNLEPPRPDRSAEARARATTILRLPHHRPLADGEPLVVRAGEIVGVTGLVGSGASALVRGVGGAEPLGTEIEVGGRPHRITSPRDASRVGIGFIPEDRKGAGVFADMSVIVNMAMPALQEISRAGVLDRARMEALGVTYQQRLDIRLPSLEAPIRTLSGGNQQKVLLARWLASGVRVLAIDEPTHGVDVGGKAQIHRLLRAFVEADRGVLFASTDLDEVLGLCDRIGVFRHGRLVAVVDPAELAATGGDPKQELLRMISGTNGTTGGRDGLGASGARPGRAGGGS